MLAYATQKNVNFLAKDISTKDKITEREMMEIATSLNVPITALVDEKKANEKGIDNYTSMDERDVLTVLKNNLDVLKLPIFIVNKKAYLIKSVADINAHVDDVRYDSSEDTEFKR
jgi:arsenate reductase-like glutaredoxin family protein